MVVSSPRATENKGEGVPSGTVTRSRVVARLLA